MPKIIENGVIREMTPEEIAEMQDIREKHEAEEKHRPLTESEVYSMIVRQQINTIEVDNQTALRMKKYYPEWQELAEQSYTAEKKGFKFQYNGKLYATVSPNCSFASRWIPGVGTESLYERIDEVHDGTKHDPIPYDGNMELIEGKYYTQNGAVYLCIRSTGTAVYHPLAELEGLYVELI